MTNDIVVEFACSVDENGKFKQYHVVNGSVFNEEYNETLDSATVVLSQIQEADRLLDIAPYQYARVFDMSGNTDFDTFYLVDNFNEKENNITEHVYGYTVNLMSETKFLEKIQCPSVTITHEVNEDGTITKKTILKHIDNYMKLFVPKMKFSDGDGTWSYQPLIKTDFWDVHVHELETQSIEGRWFTEIAIDTWQATSEVYIIDPVALNHLDEIEIYDITSEGTIDLTSTIVELDKVNAKFVCYAVTDRDPGDGYVIISFKYSYKTIKEEWKKFDIPCADLAFTTPTLRQLLTNLMLQVGCIPTVKNRTLSYLDFQIDAVPFGDTHNTINYISRSLSSDSYVNTLVNISENVLDSENEVICETLGFRDKNNVLLKQAENLYLETSLPIYKVNKCLMRGPGESKGYLSSSGNIYCQNVVTMNSGVGRPYGPWVFYGRSNVGSGMANIFFYMRTTISGLVGEVPDFTIKPQDNLIHFLGKKASGAYYIIESRELEDIEMNASTTTYDDRVEYYSAGNQQFFECRYLNVVFLDIPDGTVGYLLKGTIIDNASAEQAPVNDREFYFMHFDDSDTHVVYYPLGNFIDQPGFTNSTSYNLQKLSGAVAFYNLEGTIGFNTWDISSLVVENTQRQLLDTDFSKMVTVDMPVAADWTIHNLSKYIYGTVGYSIGAKRIEGFSNVLNVGSQTVTGWVKLDLPYIENLVKALGKNPAELSSKAIYDFFEGIYDAYSNIKDAASNVGSDVAYQCAQGGSLIDYQVLYYNASTDSFDQNASYFTSFLFDVYYQPLNSFNLSYVKKKESVDFALEQFDNNASGLTDFDRLSMHEQEQVDRIGNETMMINQRTTDISDIQTFENGPLYYMRNGIKHIIFKRSYTINNNCFNASYVGSKDAVLKDYFTSIRTKYRAYQYVDYRSSVLRKEKDVIFVRIGTDWYDGDDKIWLGNYENKKDCTDISNFIYDIENVSNRSSISYECECNEALVYNGIDGYNVDFQTVKQNVSLITFANTFAIIYECIDNVGTGTYIPNITADANLGGMPQNWQIWADDYNVSHVVSFVTFIDFYSYTIAQTSQPENVVRTQLINIEKTPIVDETYLDLATSEYNVFSVCDNNKKEYNSYKDVQRTFYKDYSERINHTVQFIYYSLNQDVLFGEDFISGITLVGRFSNPFNALYFSNNFELNTEPHSKPSGDVIGSLNIIEKGQNYLEVSWGSNFSVVKICNKQGDLIKDIAVFKKPTGETNSSTKFYFTLNDTKSDYVMGEQNGILYRKYKVKTNQIARETEDIV